MTRTVVITAGVVSALTDELGDVLTDGSGNPLTIYGQASMAELTVDVSGSLTVEVDG